jgi:hypothetical protein
VSLYVFTDTFNRRSTLFAAHLMRTRLVRLRPTHTCVEALMDYFRSTLCSTAIQVCRYSSAISPQPQVTGAANRAVLGSSKLGGHISYVARFRTLTKANLQRCAVCTSSISMSSEATMYRKRARYEREGPRTSSVLLPYLWQRISKGARFIMCRMWSTLLIRIRQPGEHDILALSRMARTG